MKTDTLKRKTGFILGYTLQIFALLLLIAILIRTYAVSSYVVSGDSMLPSVWPGEFVVGLKLGLVEPKRGDVVILRCPNEKESLCLKRIVGLPGDRIEFSRGQLMVNARPPQLQALGGEFKQETVEGVSWAIWPASQKEGETDVGALSGELPAVILPEHFYVLNDKRNESGDSRQWGPVPNSLIEARAARIWLSLDWVASDGQVRVWPRVRWHRLARRVD